MLKSIAKYLEYNDFDLTVPPLFIISSCVIVLLFFCEFYTNVALVRPAARMTKQF